MSERDYVEVYHARDAQQAYAVKAMLEDDGIPAMVTGEMLQGAIGELQAESLRVCVIRSDAERAKRLCDELDAGDPAPGAPWKCPVCDAGVDAEFDLCWSCEDPRPVSD